jgi:hypothetical protein
MADEDASVEAELTEAPFVFPDWLSRALAVPCIVFGGGVIIVCLATRLLLGGASYGQAGGSVKAAIWLVWLVLLVSTGIIKLVWLARGARRAGLTFVELMGKLVNLQYMRVVSPLLAMGIVILYVLLRVEAARYLPGVLIMVWGVMALELRQVWVWRELEVPGAWLVLVGAIMAVFLSRQLLLAVGAGLGGGMLLWGIYLLGRYRTREKTE